MFQLQEKKTPIITVCRTNESPDRSQGNKSRNLLKKKRKVYKKYNTSLVYSQNN